MDNENFEVKKQTVIDDRNLNRRPSLKKNTSDSPKTLSKKLKWNEQTSKELEKQILHPKKNSFKEENYFKYVRIKSYNVYKQ